MAKGAEALEGRAKEYFKAAQASYKEGRFHVAYEEARTAAELACKALIARTSGSFPRDHNPAGLLQHLKLIPEGISARELSRLLGDFSRGAYGFDVPVERVEVKNAIDIARKMVATF